MKQEPFLTTPTPYLIALLTFLELQLLSSSLLCYDSMLSVLVCFSKRAKTSALHIKRWLEKLVKESQYLWLASKESTLLVLCRTKVRHMM